MSQENVEVVSRIYDAVARRDAVTPFDFYAEDIVWDLTKAKTASLLTTTVGHGHEGVREVWREGLAVFARVNFGVQGLVDADDRVLAVIREYETGRASGVPVESVHFAVWTLRRGKVTRLEVFSDGCEALRAAGLSE